MINHFKKVCICRSVTGGTIMKAIREGSLSFEALRRPRRPFELEDVKPVLDVDGEGVDRRRAHTSITTT